MSRFFPALILLVAAACHQLALCVPTSNQPCLRLDDATVFNQQFPTSYEAAAVLLTCSAKEGSVVTHYAGDRGIDSSRVVCHDKPLISYDEQADRIKATVATMPFFCENSLCVFYQASGSEVFLSALVRATEITKLQTTSTEVPFLRTTVRYSFNGLLETFARRVLSAFQQNVNGEIDLRAIAFLATEAATCQIPVTPCVCRN
ncbi:unnamed protein product [Agarophyton chilense]|eukprot:gb/GEZJ01003778.1/.p1 GENE.gb/GEZJ01003778.1/~~gb/GEZJ01003778.1/.p1  ORF type:complete len:203 (-),score=21.08 gb/GEZJ01003778.1/:657-1265(-)